MLHDTSIRTRFLVSVVSNGIRALLGLASGVLIARGLNPAGYGDLMFLLGSFVAIRSLLDLGTSSAFFTFLSQQQRGRRFYLSYFIWLALQFVFTVLVVGLIVPDSIVEKAWLGQNRSVVLIAFVAAFMQQQVWQTVSQIGESRRKTLRVQLMNLAIAAFYLAMVSILLAAGRMSVSGILIILIGQYGAAALMARWFLGGGMSESAGGDPPWDELVREYLVYCRPLFAVSVVGFLYDYADKWMLQRFGGASQQGYFQIANQFATISLLATTSILTIFWKEIADARAKQDHQRVAGLYRKVSRGLVMLGAMITGLICPWSEQVVGICLGRSYAQAWPVLAIMLLFPIHQSLGQIGGTMLLATGQTRRFMIVSIVMMLLSIPVSYFILAPATGAEIPGLGMGAFGIAIKLVLLNIISVNLQAWVIAHSNGWRLDWIYQAVGIPLMIGLGFLAKFMVGLGWSVRGATGAELLVPIAGAGVLYVLFASSAIWFLPWLVGMEKREIRDWLSKRIRESS
ncbi:MAG: lipopolysaccharide biosynthesis protein [Pseudomonadota bacterium]